MTSGRARAEREIARVRSGSLLLAGTDLTEPTFRRTVVYIIEHSDAGTIGVILNRPSQTDVDTLLPSWSQVVAHPPAIFVGGPVRTDSALCLGLLRSPAHAVDRDLRIVEGRVALVDLDADPGRLGDAVDVVRVFAGYAGWGMGQLQGELWRGDWIVADSMPADVVAPAHVDLWSAVLRRQRWPLPMLATHPIEVLRN